MEAVLIVHKARRQQAFKWRLIVLSTDYAVIGQFYPTSEEAKQSGRDAASDLNISIIKTVMPDD